VSVPVLAAELIHKTIWYPTILGFLVVIFAIALFCGSVYLLLGTNLGARLGFLVAFTGLMGFMVLLSGLWITTTSPLNTLKGRIPSWKAVENVSDLSKAKTPAVRNIASTGKKVNATEAANVKAAADATLIQVQEIPAAPLTPAQKALQAKYAKFPIVTDYQVVNTYELGGGHPNPLNFEITHSPHYAVVQYCEVQPSNVPFGIAPPPPVCNNSSAKNGYLVMERDLGSLRVPPIVAFISSILLFGLGLLLLHWRERDEQLAEAAAKTTSSTPAAPVPANA
jgi:hypothetical protein